MSRPESCPSCGQSGENRRSRDAELPREDENFMLEWEFNATFRYLQLQRNSGNFCSICQELPGTDIFIMKKSTLKHARYWTI
ncbi:hypothetical protein ALC62_12229 [Cyphomyrmex costatus]|uniref:Uncharacterized protein n=1 Tax=Cyphomyrmex costatus TaxID=456900 RepID=A0A195CAA4_9HYME|nr:hypothetical protein ALC62_12229 [Cyphomyrmex costatus]